MRMFSHGEFSFVSLVDFLCVFSSILNHKLCRICSVYNLYRAFCFTVRSDRCKTFEEWPDYYYFPTLIISVNVNNLSEICCACLAEGWREGKPRRASVPSSFRLAVGSESDQDE